MNDPVPKIGRTQSMAIAIPNQEHAQNGAITEHALTAANPEADSDVDPVIEEASSPTAPNEELELLRAEQAVLHCTVDELQKLLAEKETAEQAWMDKQKELEALLEAKAEVIRELHLKAQERPAGANPRGSAVLPSGASREGPITPREEELLALSEELEDERRQLQEDEATVRAQMREMEVQMSRERAELARQRNELQRLHSEIRHELELASRHAALRDRLEPLQRRHQEMLHRKGGEPSREATPSPATPHSESATPAQAPSRTPTGLLHRLFG
ncbi:MAG TPA: hypothetical protein VKU02_30390 [Gemmataceae bacterium]|nr:hypothetical protein [Gemmataceae bacterium]